ncbi:CLUMA_CG006516, isoform A [Clunio marinus]|uniref:CLUMA_CG006516, isoform A n=1 Tax=Clunio marinus TaxID=568069 RepID=A0A1J1HY93_9DIPT|nr:CLUMA_CG006516, isoform A [Clunio marinus]
MKFSIVVLLAMVAVISAAPAPKPNVVAAVPSVYSPYYATPYSYSNYYSYPSVYSPYYSGLDIMPFASNRFKVYGSTYRVWAGTKLVIVTTDPRYFEIVLSSQKHLTKNNMYDFLVDWLGTGLLISTGQKWFTRRKIITPTFHFKILQQFIDVFNQQDQVFVDKILGRKCEKPFDVYNDVTLMSLDIISQTAMGVEVNAQHNEDSEYVKAVKEICYIISSRMMNFWQRNKFIFSLTNAKKRHDRHLKTLHSFTNDIVEKRRKQILEDAESEIKINYTDDDSIGIKKKLALLDVLLHASVDGKPLTNAEIAEEVDTFMFEGHDTVTSAITFGLYLLSQNPEAQEKIFEEVSRIVGDDLSVHPTYNQLQEMKYIECCIKEMLRIYPPVPIYGRLLDEDLEVDGKILPAGSNLNLMIFNINMDPKYFKNPEAFIPERFNETSERNENPFVYVPFSAGPRNCIGQKFAMLELKCAFCNIVRNFKLLPSKIEPKLLVQLTLKSSNGIHPSINFQSVDRINSISANRVVMDLLTFLFVLFLIFSGWFYKKYSETYTLARKLPGPKGWPILGNALMFIGLSPPELLKLLETFPKKYGRTVRFLIGPQLQVLFTDPKDCETILGSQKLIDKSDEYDFIAEWLGTGLLISNGQKWFTRRKVITPTFHFKILEQFVEVFDKHSAIFVQELSKCKGRAIDVFPFVTLAALDVVCETAMGVEVNAQLNSDSVYVKAVKEISMILSTRNFNVFLRNNFLFKLSSLGKRQKEVLSILHNFTDSVIIARREELANKSKKGINEDPIDDEIGSKKKLALLDVLLQSTINGEPLSNMDIREEVDTFMFEGHDTTTSGIAFCLYCIANNPEVQRKAFEEIRNVIGDDVTKPTTQKDLNNLHYLELVIKETLRLYPSVPFYGRKMHETVEINGKFIPKGTNVGIGPYFMGRDETLWKDPLKFDPERFSIENLNAHPYAHVPFSAGPRNCIGQKFAMLEMKSAISKTLRNFEFSVAPGYEPKFDNFVEQYKHFPMDPVLPFFGQSLPYALVAPSEAFLLGVESIKRHGGSALLIMGFNAKLFISHPKDVEALLTSRKLITKSDFYDHLSGWLGNGLLLSYGEKWTKRRKMLTPAFHFKILDEFVETFNKSSEILVKILKENENQTVDIFPKLAACALDVICETSMGVEIHAQMNSESKYVRAVNEMGEIVATKFFSVLHQNKWFHRLTPLYVRERKCLKILHDFTDNVIIARRKELLCNTPNVSDALEGVIENKRKFVLLDVLLQASVDDKPLTNLDIREEVDTFMFGGHDTTTSGMSFCLYCLAKYPKVQEKVFMEIRNVFGDDPDKNVTLNDLKNLNYLELVIKESFRIYPPVPIYGRRVLEDVDLNGKLIPKGTNVIISTSVMGQMEAFWENPEEFIPERFHVDKAKNFNPFAYVPFSAGSRNCIGQKFAMLEMKTVISKILRHYKLSVANDFKPVLLAELVLRSENGILLNIQKRKDRNE